LLIVSSENICMNATAKGFSFLLFKIALLWTLSQGEAGELKSFIMKTFFRSFVSLASINM
jgi:hypothetical protein